VAKVIGMDKIIANLNKLSADVRGNLNRQAVMAAAEIARDEIRRQSPYGKEEQRGMRKHYHIAQEIVIEEVKRPTSYTQAEIDKVIAMKVGPSRRAFHGFFIEHGLKAKDIVRKLRSGKTVKYLRKEIRGTEFIKRALETKRQDCINAMIKVFRDGIARLLK
jgi:HK97 gp10 family phage protein